MYRPKVQNSFTTWKLLVLALTLVSCLIVAAHAHDALTDHHASSTPASSTDECRGSFDQENFQKLDRMCNQCYNLFREAQLHALCRSNCFTTDYFKGCLDTQGLLEEETDALLTLAKQLHGEDP